MMDRLEVLVVGGGAAGLSAALVLGRCRRRVVVVDAGAPRNRSAHAAHGLFTRDGEAPSELLRMAREQLEPYDVPVHDDEALEIHRDAAGFVVETRRGDVLAARKLLLATGMRDVLPDVAGVSAFFGAGVHVCPYCDGWENRDRRVAVWALPETAREKALGMLTWTRDVTVLTNGAELDPATREDLTRRGLVVREEPVRRVEGEDHLAAVVLAGGERLALDALFVHLGQEQASPFAARLGCAFADNGTVRKGDGERTGVPGLWVAGDASHDLQLLAIAIAEGVKAAAAINQELREEALGA